MLLVVKAMDLLEVQLEQNPAAFDYWAWLRYCARYPEERPVGVKPRRANQLLRRHPFSCVDERALVQAALEMNLLPWQNESEAADWAPFVDLLPWRTKRVGTNEWRAPEYSAELRDEIGPRVVDGDRVFSYSDWKNWP
jgi:hypothetical protein